MINLTNIIRATALAGLIAATGAGAASAATISQTGWFSAAGNPGIRTLTATDWNDGTQTISVAQFDTSLGVLNSATITFYGDLDSAGSLTAAGAITVNQYDVSERIRLLSGSFAGPYTNLGTASSLLEINPSITSVTPGGFASGAIIGITAVDSSATSGGLVMSGAGLADYEGTGDVLFHLFTTTRFQSDIAGGNFTNNIATSARAEVSIVYDYTAPSGVPEPASLALLGMGLAGLGMLRYRR